MKNPPKQKPPDLPSWANCWASNRSTGEVKPASYHHETLSLTDEDGSELGSEWDYYYPYEHQVKIVVIVSLVIMLGLLYLAK